MTTQAGACFQHCVGSKRALTSYRQLTFPREFDDSMDEHMSHADLGLTL